MLLLLTLVLAELVPPHARINTKCYTRWSSDKTDLEIVWNGNRYSNPFEQRFFQKPGDELLSCANDACVQRLWCTDNGVVGWYSRGAKTSTTSAAVLTYQWLMGQGMKVTRVLGNGTHTSNPGHGGITVHRSTLYFFIARSGTWSPYGVPGLGAITFSEYRVGIPPENLVEVQFLLLPTITYREEQIWSGWGTILYPSGPNSITVSLADYSPRTGSLDSVIGGQKVLSSVHYSLNCTPSVMISTREIVTFPGHTCRGFVNGSTICHIIPDRGRYTWAVDRSLGDCQGCVPLSRLPSFPLPKTVLLLDSFDLNGTPFRALVGQSPVFHMEQELFIGVTSHPDSSCGSGVRNYISQIDMYGNILMQQRLNCQTRLVAPLGNANDVAYGSLIVKWGYGDQESPVLIARSLAKDDYYRVGGINEHNLYNESEEHQSLGQGIVTVQFPYKGRHLSCPANVQSIETTPDDVAIAGTSMGQNYSQCVKALITLGRVGVNASYDHCPLIAHGAASGIKKWLIDKGADPNSKCENYKPPIMMLAESGNRHGTARSGYAQRISESIEVLIDGGAAICTYPKNVLSVCGAARETMRNICGDIAEMSSVAPCEPGFFLNGGENCSGLTPCPRGYYCPGHYMRTNDKSECPSGTYGPHVGMVNVTQCRPCPPERPFSSPGTTSTAGCTAHTRVTDVDVDVICSDTHHVPLDRPMTRDDALPGPVQQVDHRLLRAGVQ